MQIFHRHFLFTAPPVPECSGSGGPSVSSASLRLVLLGVLLPLLCLLLPLVCPPAFAAADEDVEFFEGRDFRGVVRRDMAERAARTAAESAAFAQAAKLLAKEPDLLFINETHSGVSPAAPSLDGLARTLFSVKVTAVGVEGFPPNMRAVVRVSLEAPENLRAALQEVLAFPGRLELAGQILACQRRLLARYDVLAGTLLPLRPDDEGGREDMHHLQGVINELVALDILLDLLPSYGPLWAEPERARLRLAQAQAQAPDNPLLLTALAESYLQLDRPVLALEYAGRALVQMPDFARAHDVKGAALLRQRLPALAAESFSRAVSLAPRNPAYLMHRASAYLVQEEKEGMCEDFAKACGLGDCEGLLWARSTDLCLPGKKP